MSGEGKVEEMDIGSRAAPADQPGTTAQLPEMGKIRLTPDVLKQLLAELVDDDITDQQLKDWVNILAADLLTTNKGIATITESQWSGYMKIPLVVQNALKKWASPPALGWRRELIREGIEPNPGPSWKEFLDKLKERLGDDIEKLAKPLASLKGVLEQTTMLVETSDVKTYLEDPTNENSLKNFEIDKKAVAFLIETINLMETKGNVVPLQVVAQPENEEIKKRIIDYLHGLNPSENVQSLLFSLSGLSLCDVHHSQSYLTKTKYLKDNLPSEVGNPLQLDLRLLTGDLGNPNEETTVMKQLLSIYSTTDLASFVDVILLLSGSGFGKTKAIFDVAGQRYVIFLDGSATTQRDVKAMLAKVRRLVVEKQEGKITQQKMEELCSYEVLVTLGGRLVALLLHIVHGIVRSPLDWRDLQLNGLASNNYEGILAKIRSALESKFQNKESLSTVTDELIYVLKRKTSQRLVLALDEANCYTAEGAHRFSSPQAAQKGDYTPCRSFWSLLLSTVLSITMNLGVLISGTQIGLSSEDVIQSAIAKLGIEKGPVLRTITDFRCNSEEDTFVLGKRIFNFDDVTLTSVARRVPGRSRFLLGFATYLAEASQACMGEITEDVLDLLEQYVSLLLTSTKRWSLRTGINKLINDHASGKQSLCWVLCRALLDEGEIAFKPQGIDWLTYGLVHTKKAQTDNCLYILNEDLAISAIALYCMEAGISMAEYVATQDLLRFQSDPQVAGRIFDLVVALAIVELKDPTCLSFWSSLPTDFNLNWPAQRKIERNHTFESLLKNAPILPGSFLMPCPKFGPDGEMDCLPGILVNGNKTSANKEVPAAEVAKNGFKTCLEHIYTQYVKKLKLWEYAFPARTLNAFNTLAELSAMGNFRLVIALRFILPSAEASTTHDFQAGTIHIRNRTITYWDTRDQIPHGFTFRMATVDIDSSCLRSLGLFSAGCVNTLLSLYPAAVTRTQWKVQYYDDLTTEIGLDGGKLSKKRKQVDECKKCQRPLKSENLTSVCQTCQARLCKHCYPGRCFKCIVGCDFTFE